MTRFVPHELRIFRLRQDGEGGCHSFHPINDNHRSRPPITLVLSVRNRVNALQLSSTRKIVGKRGAYFMCRHPFEEQRRVFL